MDCKDLMIYDYVKYNGVTKIVDAVYLYSVSVHDPSEEWSISEAKTYSIDDIEPIELTEDILVKNGWDFRDRQYAIECKEDEQGIVELSRDEDGYYWSINWDEYLIIRIHYIHELQHILRLCGIEKELVID
jgi:hypothetical protein